MHQLSPWNVKHQPLWVAHLLCVMQLLKACAALANEYLTCSMTHNRIYAP